MSAPEALARAGELRAVAATMTDPELAGALECAGQALHRIACAVSNPNVSSLAVALGAHLIPGPDQRLDPLAWTGRGPRRNAPGKAARRGPQPPTSGRTFPGGRAPRSCTPLRVRASYTGVVHRRAFTRGCPVRTRGWSEAPGAHLGPATHP